MLSLRRSIQRLLVAIPLVKSVVLPLLLMGNLLACPAHAAAEEPLPAPCIERVCVGAGLGSLLTLPWLQVNLPGPSTARMRGQRRIARALRGDAGAVNMVLTYWPWRWFNAPALQALASLSAVCEDMGYSWRPRSMLKGPAGSRLVVAFEPVPSAGPRQVFQVATITVQFAKDADAVQASRLRQELRERFEHYPSHPTEDKPAARWQPGREGQPSLTLYAPLLAPDQGGGLYLQPACKPEPVASATPGSS
ncbi:hypothetical protein [Azohydromonas caseinilytica]|uniref:Uncharacterized protein n=1 Tax=Azohydromonas caseinilytica TaxID=2728836 RepID=A0A848FH62_9BURK|nr:hypothetical protein [Azohydromonas caseinilytica]NML18175.1 hypothetical protein [Azohydromonas caseinilytica]